MRLPVTLTLKASPKLAAALLVAHGLAAIEAAAIGVPGTTTSAAAAVILLSLGFSLQRHFYRRAVTALTLKADGTLEAEYRGELCCVAQIDSRTTVFSWLVVLLLRIGNRDVPVVLLPDSLGSEAHRQLRLWLRWKASAATA